MRLPKDAATMKPDEKSLLVAIAENKGWRTYETSPPISLDATTKRHWYIVGKFVDWGWLEYGTSMRNAWLTPEGFDAARAAAGLAPLATKNIPRGPDARVAAGLPARLGPYG